jgi:hypothetical protein
MFANSKRERLQRNFASTTGIAVAGENAKTRARARVCESGRKLLFRRLAGRPFHIRLDQGNRIVFAVNADQNVAIAASRADEITPVDVNFGREIAEITLDTAVTTGPHNDLLPAGLLAQD